MNVEMFSNYARRLYDAFCQIRKQSPLLLPIPTGHSPQLSSPHSKATITKKLKSCGIHPSLGLSGYWGTFPTNAQFSL